MFQDDRVIWLYDNADGSRTEKVQEDEHVAKWGGIESYTARLESKGWYREVKEAEEIIQPEIPETSEVELKEDEPKKTKKKKHGTD